MTLHNQTRQYSTFKNWYEDEDYTKIYFGNTDISTKKDDNVKIYAKYKGDMFDLNLITNGGYIASGDIDEYEYGLDTYLPTNVIAEDEDTGKAFYGWYDNADFEGNRIYKISKTDFGTKTFYARYENTHTISFNSNGGTGYMGPQVVFEIDNTNLAPNRFSRNRYFFSHWEGSNGRTYENSENIGNLTFDLSLKAIWIKESGGGGGGGGLSLQQNAANNNQVQSVTLQSNPTEIKANTTNSNWQQSANGTWQIIYTDAKGQQQLVKDSMVNIPTVVTVNVNGIPTNVTVEAKYYFDPNGNMYTGWLTPADGSKMFFNTDQGADRGKMSTGWKQISGNYYYFGQDGKMLSNTTTPDGYKIGQDGTWQK